VGEWSHALLVLEDLHLATLRSNEICWGATVGACKTSSCWTLAVELLRGMSLADNGTTALQLVFFGFVPTAGCFLLKTSTNHCNHWDRRQFFVIAPRLTASLEVDMISSSSALGTCWRN